MPRRNSADAKATSAIILQQLGGSGRVNAMLGFPQMHYGTSAAGPYLSIKFKSPHRGPNHVKITLTPLDTYNVEFSKIHGMTVKPSGTYTDIYAEGLKPLFERVTGLYLSLGTMGRSNPGRKHPRRKNPHEENVDVRDAEGRWVATVRVQVRETAPASYPPGPVALVDGAWRPLKGVGVDSGVRRYVQFPHKLPSWAKNPKTVAKTPGATVLLGVMGWDPLVGPGKTTTRQVAVRTLREASRVVTAHVADTGMGGSNMPKGFGDVRVGGKLVARVSYNGRVWPAGTWTPQTREIEGVALDVPLGRSNPRRKATKKKNPSYRAPGPADFIASGQWVKVGRKHYRHVSGVEVVYDHNHWGWRIKGGPANGDLYTSGFSYAAWAVESAAKRA